MDRRAAKELLHVKVWLARVEEVLALGREAHLSRRKPG